MLQKGQILAHIYRKCNPEFDFFTTFAIYPKQILKIQKLNDIY